MSQPSNSYSSHRRSSAPPDMQFLEPAIQSNTTTPPPRLETPYPSRAYFHADIGEHHISLHFTNLPVLHIKALRPLISYYWWPRKSSEVTEKATQTTIFNLTAKGPKGWDSYEGYRAKRDFVRLQLEIFRALHSYGWMFRETTSYALQQPGWISKLTRSRPDFQFFSLARTSTRSNPCYWLMLTMHYRGELWLVTSAPQELRQEIVQDLSQSVSISREEASFYRIILREPFEVDLLVVVDILKEFEFTKFASIQTWPPVIVLTRPQDREEQAEENQRV